MKKQEFLNELSIRLSLIEKTERQNIISYYDELIEDTIERTGQSEDEVVVNLGSIDDIIKKLNINNSKKKIVIDDDINKENNRKTLKETINFKENKALIILIIILTSPLWISLVVAILGTGIGIIIGTIGIIVGMYGVLTGLFLGGLGLIFAGFTILGLAYGVLLVGLGFILIGLGIILFPIIIKFSAWLIGLYVKVIKVIFNQIINLISKMRKDVVVNEN